MPKNGYVSLGVVRGLEGGRQGAISGRGIIGDGERTPFYDDISSRMVVESYLDAVAQAIARIGTYMTVTLVSNPAL